MDVSDLLADKRVETSAPCRIDMGGTVDIRSFYYPLRHLAPCTFNIAVGLRTTVRLAPFDKGRVKVTSRGFDPAEYAFNEMPFDHPVGFVFAIAAYFNAAGVHIDIQSTSPPKSALGGSSVAGVALAAAFGKLLAAADDKAWTRCQTAILAHALEESVAGVPCGLQDQLAAAYGGVNAWYWSTEIDRAPFRRKVVIGKRRYAHLGKRVLLAYCGIPHVSKDINTEWVRQFLAGRSRNHWVAITHATRRFISALAEDDLDTAVAAMQTETALRLELTPQVLDNMGTRLMRAAEAEGCGARFTGAGGGGCVWALGHSKHIDRLKGMWENILASHPDARLLEFKIDGDGLMIEP
jgi:D-glycero-alpha-D-manno-heptose-7-phosphate kinase